MLNRFSIFAAALLLSIIGCSDKPNPECPSSSDGDADVDTDSDTDTDSDSETDTESDTGDPIVALPVDCSGCQETGSTVENMLCAFDICDPIVISENTITTPVPATPPCTVELMYEAVSHFGNVSNDLAPKKYNSYGLLASGVADVISHSFGCCNSEQGPDDPFSDGGQYGYDLETWDNLDWKISITAPEEAEAFRFKYVFLSEEYDEYIDSSFNDKFYVILEAESTNEGEPTIINYSECRDPSEQYDFNAAEGCDLESGFCCYITINSALSECCWYGDCPNPEDNTDIGGTGFECAPNEEYDTYYKGSSTGWLQTSWPIEGGETFSITFHIHDTYDSAFDSEVILDSFEFLTTEQQGTVPVIE